MGSWSLLLVCWLALFGQMFAQSKTVAERLGYPADSRLLIIHADDLALAHSVDSASSTLSTKAPSLPPAS